MKPEPLAGYNKKCYHSGCNGTITITKILNKHIWIDTIMNGDNNKKYILKNIPHNIQIGANR